MIGLDTSHVIAFTKAFNDPEATGDLAEMRVVAGFPGGTDIPPSRDRVAGFTQQLKEMGIEIVDSIPDLLSKVDVVLLESVDGRPHLEQARLVIEAGKPLFIDKPVAGSLKDAVAIFRLAEKHDVPCFSSSSLRYVPEAIAYRDEKSADRVNGCVVWGPCSIQPPMPDLFFYGVHGVEMLYTIMGTGCVSVTRSGTESTDVVTGVWQDGRIGTYRGLRSGKKSFGAVVFETDRIALIERSVGYQPLLDQIARFFKSGKAPVAAAETIEIFAFMEAADESKRLGGKPVQMNP
ncbi:MAG: Gfo/Idh/MocA family oxidoreductase [Planctomycetaceae bacterium]|nr:Gfo/Idh/MocA family oxidoreductase [Planctomycetaceae bacterium]